MWLHFSLTTICCKGSSGGSKEYQQNLLRTRSCRAAVQPAVQRPSLTPVAVSAPRWPKHVVLTTELAKPYQAWSNRISVSQNPIRRGQIASQRHEILSGVVKSHFTVTKPYQACSDRTSALRNPIGRGQIASQAWSGCISVSQNFIRRGQMSFQCHKTRSGVVRSHRSVTKTFQALSDIIQWLRTLSSHNGFSQWLCAIASHYDCAQWVHTM